MFSHYNWFRLGALSNVNYSRFTHDNNLLPSFIEIMQNGFDCRLSLYSRSVPFTQCLTCFTYFTADRSFSFISKTFNVFHCNCLTTATLSLNNVDWWKASAKCESNFQSFQTQQIQLLIEDRSVDLQKKVRWNTRQNSIVPYSRICTTGRYKLETVIENSSLKNFRRFNFFWN